METLFGIAVSPGLAMAKALILRPKTLAASLEPIAPEEVQAQVESFREAVDLAGRQLRKLAAKVRSGLDEDEAGIFEADLVLLEDEEFLTEVVSRIRKRERAPDAVMAVCRAQAEAVSKLTDAYLRQRAPDILALGRRLADNCLGLDPDAAIAPEDEVAVVARELTPAEVALLPPGRVAAIVTEAGGPASHAAILAASLGIPAVVQVAGALHKIKDGDVLLVDAVSGRVVVDPDEALAREFAAGLEPPEEGGPDADRELAAVTADGARITLLANIGSAGEAGRAATRGAEGVGLFRLEFMYLGRNQAPGEEELYQAFAAALAAMPGRDLVVRILDAGGDKDVSYLGLPRGENPALGLRGVRLAFSRPDIFAPQLRAALRAAALGKLSLLLPMVTEPGEARRFRDMLAAAGSALDAEGTGRAASLPVGAMVETPAAVFLAGQIAREADFLSIGSNDLAQYVLAVDRGDEAVAGLYDAFHPAVLAAIAQTVTAARAAGKPVCVCGELAGEAQGAMLLVGLGVRELSMSPGRIPAVKQALADQPLSRLEKLAKEALALDSAAAVRRAVSLLDG
jgi:phosphoenolpyruvate-protein phosphotransferase (PTS system enzyme I)